jgi:phosphate transport system substrate-binding protein
MERKTVINPLLAGAMAAAVIASASPANAQGNTQINGSGSTFMQPIVENWAFLFSDGVDKTAKINYGGGGSGKGKSDIIAGTVDFAGTDAPLTDAEAARKPMVQIPAVAGAVVVPFNVPGVKDLVFNGDALGKIYAGKIEKWNDPAIKALNPKANLPNIPIIVVHRSDGSGTTNIFTTYLTKASKDWSDTVNPSKGTTVDWPADKVRRGLGGAGNQGVAAAVQKTRGAIGYVELAYALNNKIPYSKMINAAGNTIEATPAATTAAMKDGVFNKRLAADIQNSNQPNAWPISGYAYLILNKDYKDCALAQKLLSWVTWSITSQAGKDAAAKGLYATIPPEIVPQVGDAIKSVTCNNGNPVFK